MKTMLRHKGTAFASFLLLAALAGVAFAVWTAGLNYAVHDPMGDPTRDSRITLSSEYKLNYELGLRWDREKDPDIRYEIGSTFGAGLQYKLTDKPSFRIGAEYRLGTDELRTRLGGNDLPKDSAERALFYSPLTMNLSRMTDEEFTSSMLGTASLIDRGFQVRVDDGRYVTDQSGTGTIPKLDLGRYLTHTTHGGYTWAGEYPILEGGNSLMLPQWNFTRGILSGG